MNEKQGRLLFGAYICTLVAGLQVVAWMGGFNGAVFAFTTSIITGISGVLFGFSLTKKT